MKSARLRTSSIVMLCITGVLLLLLILFDSYLFVALTSLMRGELAFYIAMGISLLVHTLFAGAIGVVVADITADRWPIAPEKLRKYRKIVILITMVYILITIVAPVVANLIFISFPQLPQAYTTILMMTIALPFSLLLQTSAVACYALGSLYGFMHSRLVRSEKEAS